MLTVAAESSCHWEVLWAPLEIRHSTNVSYNFFYKKTELNGTCWEKEFLERSIRLLGHSFVLLFAFDGV